MLIVLKAGLANNITDSLISKPKKENHNVDMSLSIGQLNSWFYIRFWSIENIYMKAGFSIYHIIENTSNYSNNLLYTGTNMVFISLGWTPLRTA